MHKDIYKNMREAANLTQRQLAENLGVDQASVSRYEANEANIPSDIKDKWKAICGYVQPLPDASSFDPGNPYALFDQNLSLLRQYLDAERPTKEVEGIAQLLADTEFLLNQHSERPLVAFFGRFDSGKSHLINFLLGTAATEVRYQPCTALPVIFRHLNQKPAWMQDDVYILDEGFNPVEWLSEAKVSKHRRYSGTLDILKTYGVHEEAKDRDPANFQAFAFVDSPILLASSLMDVPGFNAGKHDGGEGDTRAITFAITRADSVVYLAPFVGCVDSVDLTQIPLLLQRFQNSDKPQDAFCRFTLVVSHAAGHISDEQVFQVRESVSNRLAKHLQASESMPDVSAKEILSTVLPFWAENAARSKPFMNRLRSLLVETLLSLKAEAFSEFVTKLRDSGTSKMSALIEHYEMLLHQRDRLKAHLGALKAAEPTRKDERGKKWREILNEISQHNSDAINIVQEIFRKETSDSNILELVSAYENKDDAEKGIIPLIVQRIQGQISSDLTERSKTLMQSIQEFLKLYSSENPPSTNPFQGSTDKIELPFDPRAAFFGGLAGLTTFGLLAAMAATAGNLGGYVLIAQSVGVLSAMGISLGSMGPIMAGVATIGGPITIGLALAATIGLGAFFLGKALFGNWKETMAKRVKEYFNKEGLQTQQKLLAWAQGCLAETRKSFEAGATQVEEDYQKELRDLEERLTSDSWNRERLERLIALCKAWKDFFKHLPPPPPENMEIVEARGS